MNMFNSAFLQAIQIKNRDLGVAWVNWWVS